MGTLAPTSVDGWPGNAYTRQQINDKLTYWREHLIEHDRESINSVLTRPEIVGQINKWLDESNELRGR